MDNAPKTEKSLGKPYWWEEAPPKSYATGNLAKNADVVVIGAGFTGLQAALGLARGGKKVVVLEQYLVGEGASSRNAGITSGNIRWSYEEIAAKHGKALATKYYSDAKTAREFLYNFIEKEDIACDMQLCGRFMGVPAWQDLTKLPKANRQTDRFFKEEIVHSSQLYRYCNSPKYVAGRIRQDIGGFNPAKYLHALADKAVAAGATIMTNTQAIGIEHSGNGNRQGALVKTQQGNISADVIIASVNAYRNDAFPWLKKRILPIVSEMIATQPIDKGHVQELMPCGMMAGEMERIGYYFRPSPDGTRILLGGRRMHRNPEKSKAFLKAALVEIFPSLRDVHISHHWWCNVAYSRLQLPTIVRHENIIYPAGYCGSGTAIGSWFGAKIAAAILQGDDGIFSAYTKLPWMPLYAEKLWLIPAAVSYFRLRDCLEKLIYANKHQ